MPAVHQFVAGFAGGDAISNEARILRRVFRGWGCASEVYSEPRCIQPELRREAFDAGTCAARLDPRDVVLLHLSIGSRVNDVFAGLRCRKAILYHNVTPASWFEPINAQTAALLARAQAQVRGLATAAAVNLADSRFNADELAALGYRDVRVLPLLLDLSALRGPADRAFLARFGDGAANVLFVGRGTPNKRLEDVLRAFYFFRRHVCPDARFVHAGSFAGTERYRWVLAQQVRALDLPAESVYWLGAVSPAQLNALYRTAAVFVCMSEHEGFCAPLLESMVRDVPVLAYAAAAVPETLDGAGVLLRRKHFGAAAEMMGRLATDTAFRQAVVNGQRERLARYEGRDLAAEVRQHLAPLLTA